MLNRRRFFGFLGIGAIASRWPAKVTAKAASDAPLTITVNSPVGDRAEIGRSINDALEEYYRRTGRLN